MARPIPLLSAATFLTYDEGEVAVFENLAQGNDFLEVRVSKQLGNPVAALDYIQYGSVQLADSGTTIGILNASVGTLGAATPSGLVDMNFTVGIASIISLEPSTNSANYQFVFRVPQTPKPKRRQKKLPLSAQTMNCLPPHIVLVEDVYGGIPCTTGDTTGCDALFDGSESSIDPVADYLASGHVDAKNGGFRSVTMLAPDNLLSDPNVKMLLILNNGSDYQFFSIDVALSQNF